MQRIATIVAGLMPVTVTEDMPILAAVVRAERVNSFIEANEAERNKSPHDRLLAEQEAARPR
jgi:hypothetical protein